MRATAASRRAARMAAMTSASGASGRPYRTFCSSVSFRSTVSCGTTAVAPLSDARLKSRTSTPPTRTVPEPQSYKRVTRRRMLDLPLPLGPTMATDSPGATRRDTPLRTSLPGW
jgi:hypothetical protein